jgi:hypothetical protein
MIHKTLDSDLNLKHDANRLSWSTSKLAAIRSRFEGQWGRGDTRKVVDPGVGFCEKAHMA